MTRLEKVEARLGGGQPLRSENTEARGKRTVVCHNCQREGHYARGCALPPKSHAAAYRTVLAS